MAPQLTCDEKVMVKVLKLFQSTKSFFSFYLGVKLANANLLRGFSELSMFNYKIKDYAPEMFFTYYVKKGSRLYHNVLPTSAFFMWFYIYVFLLQREVELSWYCLLESCF